MKYKCGKCGTINELTANKISSADEAFFTTRCNNCDTVNRLPKVTGELNIPAITPVHPAHKEQQQENGKDAVPASSDVPGWLFVHDENTISQSFNLKQGRNMIGRKSAFPADIAIETKDEHMSRRHCVIEVTENANRGFAFKLSDYNALNGTFINGRIQKKLEAEDIILLNDGDTLQLGLTKIVFRINTNMFSKEKIMTQLNETAYSPTVYIKRK
jgi:FHA domain